MSIFTFGEEQTYHFEEVDINIPIGNPIYVDGILVGGLKAHHLKDTELGYKIISIEGIEILPKFRKQGIAKEVIKCFKERYDIVSGGVDNYDSLGFWEKMGAKIIDLPKEIIPSFTKKTEILVSFFISNDEIKLEKMLNKFKKHIEDKKNDKTRKFQFNSF